MLMPDRQAVLRDAVDQLLDAVGRGEVRSPSDCVRVLREMADDRPCGGCGGPRTTRQEPCSTCGLGNAEPVTHGQAAELVTHGQAAELVTAGDVVVHVPVPYGIKTRYEDLAARNEVLRLWHELAKEKRRSADWKRRAEYQECEALTYAAMLRTVFRSAGLEVQP